MKLAEPLAGIRVLVVEDDADNRDVLEESLRFLGAAVEGAPSAEEALELVHLVDIVVTDFALPGQDGVWLLEQVARSTRPVPVILLSGFATTQLDVIARAPFAKKLLKPMDRWDLAADILEVLRSALTE